MLAGQEWTCQSGDIQTKQRLVTVASGRPCNIYWSAPWWTLPPLLETWQRLMASPSAVHGIGRAQFDWNATGGKNQNDDVRSLSSVEFAADKRTFSVLRGIVSVLCWDRISSYPISKLLQLAEYTSHSVPLIFECAALRFIEGGDQCFGVLGDGVGCTGTHGPSNWTEASNQGLLVIIALTFGWKLWRDLENILRVCLYRVQIQINLFGHIADPGDLC